MSEKVRIRFSKTGDARFLSHHDLIRAFERMLRRAELPFRSTEGFHPKPKMAFASALGLGIVGHEEVIEIEFAEEISTEDVRTRLSNQSLTGLGIGQISAVPKKATAQPVRATYRLGMAEGAAPPDLPDRIAHAMDAAELWAERERPVKKRLNIRPYVIHLATDGAGLTMTLAITPQGAARPEEVLGILGLAGLLHEGGVLERTRLELADETIVASGQQRAASADERQTRLPPSAPMPSVAENLASKGMQ